MKFWVPSLLILSLLFQLSQSTTILVDGVSEWKDPTVHVGDSVIFKHKYHYSLYIFQNQRAFNICNFTQATLLTKPNSTYTWYPSRPGMFYFTFNNGSMKSTCQVDSQKLAIRVSNSTIVETPEPSPVGPALPPAYPWPFRPKQQAASPLESDKGGGGSGGIPFINSNPAVPLPTGEVDSATITALPISSSHTPTPLMMGYLARQTAIICMALPLML